MSKVLLDNWGLISCARTILGFTEDRYYDYYSTESITPTDRDEVCWQNFLTCLILWDDIYFNLTRFTPSIQHKELLRIIRFITSIIEDPNFVHTVDLHSISTPKPDLYKYTILCEKIKEYNSNQEGHLLIRGYNYLLQANYLGYNYLPHPDRAKVLYDSGIFQKGFDRTLYLDILDADIQKYIDEVNSLCKHQLLTTRFPVLYKFIHENAMTLEDELSIALSLREERSVKKFRKSINDIEEKLKKGNIFALDVSLKRVNEICDDITNKMYKKPMSFGVSLGLSPTLNVDMNTRTKAGSKLHTTFLYDIANFAIKGEINRRYRHIIKP